MSADDRAQPRRGARVCLVLSVLFVAGGAVMRLGALDSPLVADDFAQRAMLGGTYPVHRNPLDLYNFADGTVSDTQALMNGGSLPWWSHPHVKYVMLRPLSSALLWLDQALLGGTPFAAHAHSLVWWVATAGVVAWLLRSVLPQRAAALATLLFVVHQAHTWPVVWLANRNALVSALFGALALKAYARWRERSVVRDAVIASLGFGLSCLGGEMGLCFAGYVIAYEIVVARGHPRRRLAALMPALAPFLCYAILYRVLKRGAFGSDVYLDPLSEPAAYARAAGPRMLALLSDLIAGTPGEQWDQHGSLGPLLRVVAPATVIVVAAFIWSARRLERRAKAHAYWLALGAPLAILPILASFVTARLLLPAAIGACAAFAVIVEGALSSAVARGGGGPRVAAQVARRWLLLFAGAAVLYVHVGLAARRSLRELDFWKRLYRGLDAGTADAELDRGRLSQSTVVLLACPDPHTLLYAPSVWEEFGLAKPERWRVLSMALGPHAVMRVADDALELSPLTDEFVTKNFEVLFRSASARMHVGDVVRLDGMTATVLMMGRIGPKSVRFQFDRSLDAPTMTLLVAEGGQLRRFRPPDVGAADVIGPATAPMKLP